MPGSSPKIDPCHPRAISTRRKKRSLKRGCQVSLCLGRLRPTTGRHDVRSVGMRRIFSGRCTGRIRLRMRGAAVQLVLAREDVDSGVHKFMALRVGRIVFGLTSVFLLHRHRSPQLSSARVIGVREELRPHYDVRSVHVHLSRRALFGFEKNMNRNARGAPRQFRPTPCTRAFGSFSGSLSYARSCLTELYRRAGEPSNTARSGVQLSSSTPGLIRRRRV
ncbi:hypothetical protein BV20DRAFT_611866 [Pilatotrama ljubarskyi]|nr:hypothetical protein BV20DRAFT_611866 [Pilatotrama ljubarskyi]